MIKRALLTISAICLISFSGFSQKYNSYYGRRSAPEKLNSISVEYGFLSTVNIGVYLVATGVDYLIDEYGNEVNRTGYTVTGPLGISYMRRFNNFEVGAEFWLSRHSINFSGYSYGSPTVKTYAFLLSASYIYLNKNNFQLYSGLSIGPGYIGISNIIDDSLLQKLEKYLPLSSMYLASHLNVFGVRYGKDFGVTVETGFGHKGLIHFGVDYRF
ncbi:hypothetical protein ACE1ET_12085 [Saccharicrinis sp. FJH62]|uniref:hypothetical protein n=1 Tax=Saccharicrinis sp. FJH62 TaxID=3344657 RepID=UPI0035D4C29E